MRDDTRRILRLSLELLARSNRGHVGSTITAAIILGEQVAPCWTKDDELVLSKAHACAAEYAFHAVVSGRLSEKNVRRYPKFPYEGHSHKANGASPFTLGSLGIGVQMAVGLALGRDMQKIPGTVWCIVGDGEMQSGATCEALEYVYQLRGNRSSLTGCLRNLEIIVDANGASAAQRLPYVDVPKNIGLTGTRVEAHYCRITENQIDDIIAVIEEELC